MKVTNILKSIDVYSTNKTNVEKTKKEKSTNDNFSVSDEARDFQTVFKAVSQVPDVREAKVALIKKQIEEGTYNISSEEIANKILSK